MFDDCISKSCWACFVSLQWTEVLYLAGTNCLLYFLTNSRVTTSLQKALEKLDNSLNVKVQKCVK